MKLKILTISLFFLIMCTININIRTTKAYSFWQYDGYKLAGVTNTQKISTTLSNGKFAYVTFTTSNGGYIYVFDSDGLDGQAQFTWSGITVTYDVSIASYDKYVIVAWIGKTSSTTRLALWVVLDTVTYTVYYPSTSQTIASASSGDPAYVSNILVHGTYAYALFVTSGVEYLIKLNILTRTFTDYNLGNIFGNNNAYIFHDQKTDCAFGLAMDSTLQKPIYFYFDYDNPSGFEVLATHPYTNDIIMNNYFRLLGAGTYADSGYIYVYYTWTYTDEEFVFCIQHRLQFNGTLDSAHLQEQEKTFDICFASSYWTIAPYYVNVGTGYLENKETVYFYMVDPNLSTEKYYYTKVKIQVVGDWTDMSGTVETTETLTEISNTNEMPETIWENRLWKDPLSVWAVLEDYVDTDYFAVYYGLYPSQKIYSLSLEHYPTGEYYTNTQYLITATLKLNGIAYSGAYLTVKMDNTTLATKRTDSNGQIKFLMLTNIAGYHVLSFDITVDTTYEETIYKYITVLTNEEISEGQQTTNIMLYAMTVMLPIILIVFLPALICFFAMHHPIGFLMGLVLGGVMGTASGVIPISAMFLIALLIIVYFVVEAKKT